MKQDQLVDPKEFGLDEKSVKLVESAFSPKIMERDALASLYNVLLTKELTVEVCDEAGELRRKLVKVRTGIAAVHQVEKAFSLSYGRFVDAWKNKETLPVTQMEEKLSEIENYFENIRLKELSDLQEKRVKELLPFCPDAETRWLRDMDEDVWRAFLSTKKKEYEDRLAEDVRIEKERIAKVKADEVARLAIIAENAKLKKANEVAEKARLALKAKNDKMAEEIARQLKEKNDNERKRAAEIASRLEAELSKGDADKINDLVKDLESLKTKYTFKSAKNKKMYTEVSGLISKLVVYVRR